MNMFFFFECPCRSKYISTSWLYVTFATSFFKAHISGKRDLFFVLNYLFRSSPAAPVLELPRMTPSGLIIGMIRKRALNMVGKVLFAKDLEILVEA
jgi:hypothetical protein